MNAVTTVDRDLKELEQWFIHNTNLPERIDGLLLQRFLQCMEFNIENTKKLIEVNYTLRNKYPHIFLQRDPADRDSKNTFSYLDMVPLPGLTPEGSYKICLYRLCDFDASKLNHTADTKVFFMMSDCRFAMPDVANSNQLSNGEVQIFDMTGYTMKHLTRININTQRVYLKFLQDAYPVRMKAIHLINCPSYLDKIITFIKPFLSKEVLKLIQPHTDLESLYKAIPREMLPEEYGGNAGTILKLKNDITQLLSQKRDYLTDPTYWKIDKMNK